MSTQGCKIFCQIVVSTTEVSSVTACSCKKIFNTFIFLIIFFNRNLIFLSFKNKFSSISYIVLFGPKFSFLESIFKISVVSHGLKFIFLKLFLIGSFLIYFSMLISERYFFDASTSYFQGQDF